MGTRLRFAMRIVNSYGARNFPKVSGATSKGDRPWIRLKNNQMNEQTNENKQERNRRRRVEQAHCRTTEGFLHSFSATLHVVLSRTR